MWMRIKRELWHRGLGKGMFYSPSAAMLWEKGTLFHPGKSFAHHWVEWSKNLSKQVLSKQNPDLKGD